MSKDNMRCLLITGASSGIGYATAEYFVTRSWRVYGLSRSGKVPPGVYPLFADVADTTAVSKAVIKMIETTGRLDAVVNAAGIGGAGSIENFPSKEAQAIIATNLLGTLNVIQATVPHLRTREQATFIAISSIAGLLGVPFNGIYSATKFGVEGLIESLRLELTGTGVRAVSICPGDTATPIVSNHQYRADPTALPNCYRENYGRLEKEMREGVTEGIAPRKIVEAIEWVIQQRDPGGRYLVGNSLQKLAPILKRILPQRVFGWAMRRFYRL